MSLVLLGLLGVGVGVLGTLVGAGGGFVLTPVLLVLYPHDPPSLITAISLIVVFFNAASGSVAYRWQRRIDWRSGMWFAAATLPGSVAGAVVVRYAPERVFAGIMGSVLAAVAVFVYLLRPHAERPPPRGRTEAREISDRAGTTYRYYVPVRRGVLYSLAVGFISSFLGIGGGVIHVPLLTGILGFPTHIATATSHFVLTFMAAAGAGTHAVAGTFAHGAGLRRAGALSAGVIFGAQLGARLSARLSGPTIRRVLAVGLIALAARLLTTAAGL